MHIPDPRAPDPDNPYNPTPRTEGPTNATPFANRTFMGSGDQVIDGMAPAGPGSRLAAWLIDASLITIAIAGIISLFVGSIDVASPAANAITAPVLWLYLSLLQMTGMQTVGKRLLGIRVVRRDGSPVAAPQTLLRNAWVLFTAVPYVGWATTVIGIVIFISIFAAPQMQGLHDRLVKTAVIRR